MPTRTAACPGSISNSGRRTRDEHLSLTAEARKRVLCSGHHEQSRVGCDASAVSHDSETARRLDGSTAMVGIYVSQRNRSVDVMKLSCETP